MDVSHKANPKWIAKNSPAKAILQDQSKAHSKKVSAQSIPQGMLEE
jgi:hypothetical protein